MTNVNTAAYWKERAEQIEVEVREEEGREQAKMLEEIKRLTLLLNQHMDEVVHLTGTVEHLQRENERLRAAVSKATAVAASVHMLAAGAGAGEVADV